MALKNSFPSFEAALCCMLGSYCCFLICTQVSQETGKVTAITVSLRILQFVVIHTVKGFNVVNEGEIDVFLELSCFFYDPTDVGNLISGSSAFSKSSLKVLVHILMKPCLENSEHYFAHL